MLEVIFKWTQLHEKYCTIKLEEMYKLFILSMSEI